MPQEIERGPWWIAGRIALIAAALGIIAAFLFAPRDVSDHSAQAISYIKQWQTQWQTGHSPSPSHSSDQRVFEYYKFVVRTTPSRRSILAIPVDPRQRSFFAADTGPIHVSPGTQAANADSPTL